MKRLIILTIAMLIVIAGCGNSADDNSEYATDEEAIKALLGKTSYLDYTSSSYGEKFENGGLGGDIDPLFWWRKITLPCDKDIFIQKRGETATITITRYLKGTFNIQTNTTIITKPINDSGVRSVYLERNGSVGSAYRGWELKKISGVDIDSEGTQLSIKSVRLQCSMLDTTITTVSELFPIENIITLPANTEITITVEGPGENEIVFLHSHQKDHKGQFRSPFTYNSDEGNFQGIWYTPEEPGRYHVLFDVISHDSLFTDDVDYECKAWGLPYHIE